MSKKVKLQDSEEPISDERSRFATWLDDFLSRESITFEGSNAPDLAAGLASQQTTRWSQLFQMLQGSQNIPPAVQNHFMLLQQAISPQIANARVSDYGNAASVASTIPILAATVPEQMIGTGRKHQLLAAFIIAKRCKQAIIASNNQHSILWLLATTASEAAGLLDYRMSEAATAIRQAISSAEIAIQNRFRGWDEFKSALVNDLERVRADVQLKTDKLNELISEQKASDNKRAEDWHLEKKVSIQALRDEVNEYIKIESSVSLWRTKANWHTVAYIASGIVFGLSLIGVAWLFLSGLITGFINEVAKIPADHQFLGIAVLAIPTLAVAWLLRFIARLAIQNMTLAHDARQRHAQITTYLRLLGDPQKPISEKERILALAALFRPLPGQGAEDVNPPTIADLLKEAQEKAFQRS